MKKYLFFLSMFFVLMFPMNGYAENQGVLSMEELSIHIMPEYAYHPNDQKKNHAPLLIGYQGTMVNNSKGPQKGQIEIPLPTKEKNFRIGYVADYSSNLSKAYEIEYVLDREKETISWTTSEEIGPNERYKFVIEFFTDSLMVKKEKKSLAYDFKSFADIGLLNISFTQPEKAKNMKLTPAPEENQNHAEGDKTLSYLFQDVKAGDGKEFKMKYDRKETKPTTELNDNAVNIDEKKETKNATHLAVGAFSGVTVLSAGTLAIFLKKRKRKQSTGN